MEGSVSTAAETGSVSPVKTAMDLVQLPLAKMRPRLDGRSVNKGIVQALAASIRELGIINPLRVRSAQITESGRQVDGWEIVAGRHRYEAARELALVSVPCVVATDDELHAELAMIDENLCRAELTPMQVSWQTSRRKEIYEALHPETRHVTERGGPGRGKTTDNLSAVSFTAQTAKATGRDERTIRRDAARGEALKADADRITGTSLDKGVELDALAKLSPEERKPIIDRAAAGEKVTARQPSAPAQNCAGPTPADGHGIIDLIDECEPPAEAVARKVQRFQALQEAITLIVERFDGDTEKLAELIAEGLAEHRTIAFMIRDTAALWKAGQRPVYNAPNPAGFDTPAASAPLAVVSDPAVSDNLSETIRPADKLTHLIAAKHAPKTYPGAGEGWKQRHGRRH
ncbi:hypothetical protein CHELA1G11_70007 [Hyphomicrobiales bacterium]|nr:hypothetical protein CHELA1G2_60050 [Hyphomicrobiales bacterium]CAH1696901.1 hypothetical protein CHELA1G11_70007 [Hyphomicrobiales bacterium]